MDIGTEQAESVRLHVICDTGAHADLQIDGPRFFDEKKSVHPLWHVHGQATSDLGEAEAIDAFYMWGEPASCVYKPDEAGRPMQPYFTGWSPLWSRDPIRDMVEWQVSFYGAVQEVTRHDR